MDDTDDVDGHGYQTEITTIMNNTFWGDMNSLHVFCVVWNGSIRVSAASNDGESIKSSLSAADTSWELVLPCIRV